MTRDVRTLVLGARGYVGRALVGLLGADGHEAIGTSRHPGAGVTVRTGADLDRLLASTPFDQIVLTAPLTGADVDWLVDRVDGPRWLVLSSAQLGSAVPAPGTSIALARENRALAAGAAVVRPTMIFGRGGDRNLTRLIRILGRYRVGFHVGDGRQLVQPVHVADVAVLAERHARGPKSGLFPAGGDQVIAVRDLYRLLGEIMRVRPAVIRLPVRGLEAAARTGLVGLRRDQVRRLIADKVVDIRGTSRAFGWHPQPLARRLSEAVAEAHARD